MALAASWSLSIAFSWFFLSLSLLASLSCWTTSSRCILAAALSFSCSRLFCASSTVITGDSCRRFLLACALYSLPSKVNCPDWWASLPAFFLLPPLTWPPFSMSGLLWVVDCGLVIASGYDHDLVLISDVILWLPLALLLLIILMRRLL